MGEAQEPRLPLADQSPYHLDAEAALSSFKGRWCVCKGGFIAVHQAALPAHIADVQLLKKATTRWGCSSYKVTTRGRRPLTLESGSARGFFLFEGSVLLHLSPPRSPSACSWRNRWVSFFNCVTRSIASSENPM